MARRTKNWQAKKAIYVFWEGESEEAYIKFLNKHFRSSAAIQKHREKGTFVTARAFYRGNRRFQSDVQELDELWFFFDTEIEKGDQWKENWDCLADIIASRPKKNPIKIRLLMTSCCLEYWLLLHYKQTKPSMATPADKKKIENLLIAHAAKESIHYEKGDLAATSAIAAKYDVAIPNGQWVLESLKAEGLPDDPQLRDEWLFRGIHTFTTVHEALLMLLSLPKLV